MAISPDVDTWFTLGADVPEAQFQTWARSVQSNITAAANSNLLINGDFQLNQRAYAGTALTAGVYGRDRWKADTGGATYSVAGYVVTLSAGTIVQPVEPGFWGVANFASVALTLSVDTPSADLTVTIGSTVGTITAGAGRRSVTLTPAAGDTGTLNVKFAKATGGTVTFGRVRLEVGSTATPWIPRSGWEEIQLARRYFEIITGVSPDRILRRGYGTQTGNTFTPVSFIAIKRTAPTMTLLNAAPTNSSAAAIFNPLVYEFEFFQTISAASGFTYFGYSADAEL